MPTIYNNLHAFSYYSFLEGQASPQELVEAAVQADQTALALTDRHRLSGVVRFVDACNARGIKPIVGLTVSVAHYDTPAQSGLRDLVLLAQDQLGWVSLCRLSSSINDSELPYLPLSVLSEQAEGLLCLSGTYFSELPFPKLNPETPARLSALRDIFEDRLYVQIDQVLHAEQLMNALYALAREQGLPPVATSTVYFTHPDDANYLSLLAAMRMNTTESQVQPQFIPARNSGFNDSDQFADLYASFPEALDNIAEVVSRCDLTLPMGETQFPVLELPEGETVDSRLRTLAYEGARARYGEISEEIQQRLEHELTSISAQGYGPLFLIMADILQYAHEADVPSGSRGSASSSLVAHCLGITSPDPMQLDLYFERFLNPARNAPPDIDVDLSSARRDTVLEYVYDRYGHERVAMVATTARMRRRSALREVAKAQGLSSAEIKKLVDELPRRWWGPPRGQRSGSDDVYGELRQKFPDYDSLFDLAKAMRGRPSHQSVHPGGIVISPGPIHDLVPTQRSAKGLITTQFDLDDIERIGLVKLDLLGIRSLSVLGWVGDHLYKHGRSPHARQVDFIAAIPEEDAATSEHVASSNTVGCFQIESEGMRGTLQEIGASTRDEIMAALALFRPGPMTGGLKDAFVRRHLGQEEVKHLHPALAPLLQDTYGVILYQEQVLKIAHELAGLSLADADLLRRAMSHFDPGERMQTLKERFVRGAEDKSGVPPAIGERVWELMAAFAGYGFPKAHAAAYAEIAWKSAYVKAHWPAEFMAAVMANWGGYYRQSAYIEEARRLGFQVRGPHVNYSARQFTVAYLNEEAILFMGLDQIKDLTRRTQKAIMRERTFQGLDDFLTRVDPRPKELDHLARVGALTGYASIPALLERAQRNDWRQGQPGLFDVSLGTEVEEWTAQEVAQGQKELLGISLD